MAKIGVFFSAGYEEIEALTVVDLCRRAGIEVTMVSVDETAAVTGSHQITVQMDQLLSETDFDAFDLLVLPGIVFIALANGLQRSARPRRFSDIADI